MRMRVRKDAVERKVGWAFGPFTHVILTRRATHGIFALGGVRGKFKFSNYDPTLPLSHGGVRP